MQHQWRYVVSASPWFHLRETYIANIIINAGVQMILVDEAEQLNESGFASLSNLARKTGCSLILVGDGNILPHTDNR